MPDKLNPREYQCGFPTNLYRHPEGSQPRQQWVVWEPAWGQATQELFPTWLVEVAHKLVSLENFGAM